MEGSTHAIVLHTTKYGETSIMLHCYTEQAGLRSYVVKGARSKKKNKALSMGMFQPLTQLELLASTPKSTRLPILKAAKIIHPYATISTDVVKSSICLFLAEVFRSVLKEEEEKEKEIEYIKIREWEDKFDRDQKLREQEEMRREQRLIQKEMERRAKFDNIDNNSESSLSQLEKFSIDKSKKN